MWKYLMIGPQEQFYMNTLKVQYVNPSSTDYPWFKFLPLPVHEAYFACLLSEHAIGTGNITVRTTERIRQRFGAACKLLNVPTKLSRKSFHCRRAKE